MRRGLAWAVLVSAATTAGAWAWDAPVERGSWVSVQIEVNGRTAPLYPSSDGTRSYFEARPGAGYEIQLTNRTGERLGVELDVDGLNVISGDRHREGQGRMYILAPWQSTSIRGWRTSLEAVRRFTFVDEKQSYAARSGKANEKMGWVELAVYRERRMAVREEWRDEPRAQADTESDRRAAEGARKSAPSPSAGAATRSYPGTGWGEAIDDRVRLVDFDPETAPIERTTLRYEYRAALQALGVLPSWDRLSQREHAERGFAQPPRW